MAGARPPQSTRTEDHKNLQTASKTAGEESHAPINLNPQIGPEDILSICKSYAQRRKSWNPWPKGSAGLFEKLQHWVSTPGSALFVVRATRCVDRRVNDKVRARVKDFAVEVADFLKSTTAHKLIWTFSLSSQPHMSITDIIDIIIHQAVRYVTLNVPQTTADYTENQLFDRLRLVLSELSKCFVIIETTNIDLWARLFQLSQDLIGRADSMIKILVVSYEMLPDLLQRNNSIIATIGRPLPRPKKPKGHRRVGDTRWQRLNPIFLEQLSISSGRSNID